jgi:transcriptional regulator with XRE-family HTH domain
MKQAIITPVKGNICPVQRLQEIRGLNDLTQKEAASLLGVSFSYYAKVESGYCKAGRGFIERFKKLYPFEDASIFF